MTEEKINVVAEEKHECNCPVCKILRSDCTKKFLLVVLASFIGCSLAILAFAPKKHQPLPPYPHAPYMQNFDRPMPPAPGFKKFDRQRGHEFRGERFRHSEFRDHGQRGKHFKGERPGHKDFRGHKPNYPEFKEHIKKAPYAGEYKGKINGKYPNNFDKQIKTDRPTPEKVQ